MTVPSTDIKVPLSKPVVLDSQLQYVQRILQAGTLSGQGTYTQLCETWLEKTMENGKAFLTTSGTSALEMAAMLCSIQEGDEVIVPSYTYVSTINAFVIRGAVPVFIDIEGNTMNMDATKIEAAITAKTKAIVPVHYAGISCDMDTIMDIAKRHNLTVIEDAAQGTGSTYKGRALGTIGDIGCVSFHETKNFTSGGQGGAVLVNRAHLIDRAEVIYDNGTNRVQFMRGHLEQYSWVDIGSNYVLSEVLAALLWAHLEIADQINEKRQRIWQTYAEGLTPLVSAGHIILPQITDDCVHNAHIFYIKVTHPPERKHLIKYMKAQGLGCAPHYMPLHSTQIGLAKGRYVGEDAYTTLASTQLLRLPLYYDMTEEELQGVISVILSFWL